jgi:hypothetical protein
VLGLDPDSEQVTKLFYITVRGGGGLDSDKNKMRRYNFNEIV